MTYETIHSEIIYHGSIFDVRKDQISLPNGEIHQLDIVDHPGAVTLLPIDEKNQIWFVRQYRQGAQQELLELPAGSIELGEDPAVCAQRESREEIGMAARNLQLLGRFYLAPGYSTELLYAFLATDLYPAPLTADSDEFLSVIQLPMRDVIDMAEKGEILDGKTLATLYLARPLIESLLNK
jgi:ADP-ribose pyrophosphatase